MFVFSSEVYGLILLLSIPLLWSIHTSLSSSHGKNLNHHPITEASDDDEPTTELNLASDDETITTELRLSSSKQQQFNSPPTGLTHSRKNSALSGKGFRVAIKDKKETVLHTRWSNNNKAIETSNTTDMATAASLRANCRKVNNLPHPLPFYLSFTLLATKLTIACAQKIICIGRNYADHITELKNTTPKQPFFFLKPPTSILPPRSGPVLIPRGVKTHYEVELGLVMGKSVRDLDANDEKGWLGAIESKGFFPIVRCLGKLVRADRYIALVKLMDRTSGYHRRSRQKQTANNRD